ncbi:MAG: hypothetical protein K2G50_02625 [Anaeroplasmataceae bacterium]|nr:hypothetical protein [Anaeroplasmataceae bacterium]
MLGIIKGDTRYEALSMMFESKISNELCDFYGIDGLVLPLAGIDDHYNIKQSSLNLLDILNMNDIEYIVVGKANDKLKELCLKKNIYLLELLKEPEYVMENAALTAEGLLPYLSTKDLSIKDQRFLILGYGNISYYLAKLFKAIGAEFQIYPVNELEKKFLLLEDYKLADFKDFDVVINTIPKEQDWDYEKFRGKRIIEVSSFPYGFDIEKLTDLGIRY